MKNILITGGAVHAYLDAVKIITNRFKGGLMAQLAEDFARQDAKVTYVCPGGGVESKKPAALKDGRVFEHHGFEDYKNLVIQLAPEMDAVILGAAVANLIPVKPLKGKFPSHNYKPGDIIPIDFTIAPRVIDLVKKAAPKTHLFGFKLLAGVDHEELIRAAYEIVLSSGVTAVFANDVKNLKQKFAVTKERGIHPLDHLELAPWIWQIINDEYYRTILVGTHAIPPEAELKIKKLISKFSDKFRVVENGMIFGTIAVRHNVGFVTTGRGKKELDDIVYVLNVDHQDKVVFAGGSKRASLNAPLLVKIFENPNVEYIIHYHQQEPGIPTFPYAPPGTERDTNRPNATSFNILEHGCMLLFDKDGRRL